MTTYTRFSVFTHTGTTCPETDPDFGPDSIAAVVRVLVQDGTRIYLQEGDGQRVERSEPLDLPDEDTATLCFALTYAALRRDDTLEHVADFGETPSLPSVGDGAQRPLFEGLFKERAADDSPPAGEAPDHVGFYL